MLYNSLINIFFINNDNLYYKNKIILNFNVNKYYTLIKNKRIKPILLKPKKRPKNSKSFSIEDLYILERVFLETYIKYLT